VSLHPRPVSYGAGVADDAELRLCGDLNGKRVIELGLAPGSGNAIPMAQAGAKTIVVDPDALLIAATRRLADEAEVHVECHQGDLADLGFATSASVDLVLSVHRLVDVDDLPRVLRQAHRVLKPEAPLVIAVDHPAGVEAGQRYGSGTFSIGSIFTSLLRTDFRVDVMHELFPLDRPEALLPVTLVIRARKLGL
jgi:SAM-dependent methyltransferase